MAKRIVKNFSQYFKRHFPDTEKFRKEIRPVLRLIIVAREPLPLTIIQDHFKWKDQELRDYTKQLASLCPVTGEAGSEVIAPVNKPLVDWLTNEGKAGAYFTSDKKGHRVLSNIGWKEFQDCQGRVRNMSRYFVSHLPTHLDFLKDRTRLSAVGANFPFLIEKYLVGKKTDYSFHDLLSDLPQQDTPLKFCWQGDFWRLMILVPPKSRSSLTSEAIAEQLSSVRWEYQASTPYDDDCYLMARSPFDDQYYLWAWFTSLSYEPTSIQSHRPPYFDED